MKKKKLREISIFFQNDSDLSIKLHIDQGSVFYSQYFWYVRFENEYTKNIGFNAGIEQGEFKLLEVISNLIELNWDIIEKIRNNEIHENDEFT